jgi:hypothetical protein
MARRSGENPTVQYRSRLERLDEESAGGGSEREGGCSCSGSCAPLRPRRLHPPLRPCPGLHRPQTPSRRLRPHRPSLGALSFSLEVVRPTTWGTTPTVTSASSTTRSTASAAIVHARPHPYLLPSSREDLSAAVPTLVLGSALPRPPRVGRPQRPTPSCRSPPPSEQRGVHRSSASANCLKPNG